jgi:hypothetical protein
MVVAVQHAGAELGTCRHSAAACLLSQAAPSLIPMLLPATNT